MSRDVTQSSALSCKELVELVTLYLEQALAPRDRDRFDRHIAACDGCDRYLQQMRLTIRTLGRLPEAAITPMARGRLLHAFRDWKLQR